MSKLKPFSDQLRAALDECGQSRYQVSRQTGISQPALSRFVNGERGLSLATIDALCEYLELELVSRRKPTKGG